MQYDRHAPRIGPRWGTIKEAVGSRPTSRSKLYVLGGEHPDLFRKNGRSTIVDLWLLDDIIEALPRAQIRPSISTRIAERKSGRGG